ncbi:Transcription factor bhlh [Thalictrum thalictroides]|uniref:Transcription factor bhlh n=1 Tax=Thalictrum thalictroides TaxID=46969 RepID=A0A7J6VLW9_THATH|nr:Transcription factor bhlh [Thalictrum thalictroides]
MGTHQLGSSPFQEATRTQQDIISSWLDLDDEFFQQEIVQDLENHLFILDQTDPISSTSLAIPVESPFMHDLYNFNSEQAGSLQPNIQNHHQPILPVEKCVQPDVQDIFLNDYEFGLISPTDPSPDINNINDPLGDVEISDPVMTTSNVTESNNKTDDEDGTDEDPPKKGKLNSKNMVSERNRRKRFSNQLISLRTLVPNITKMDKRSVLVDALSYLTKIHEETELLQKEIKEQLTGQPKFSDLRESSDDNESETLGIPCTTSALVAVTKSKAQITEIDMEEIEDKRFIVKITCKGGVGVGSDVLQVFESLDFEITSATLQQSQPQQVLVTIFVRVNKQWKMTEQRLKHSITSMALRTGLSLLNP